MFAKLAPYRKTVSAVVIGLLGWGGVVVASAPSGVTGAEWLGLGTALATAVGVFSFANKPA